MISRAAIGDSTTPETMFQRPDSVGTALSLDSFPPDVRAKYGSLAGGVENDRAIYNAALFAAKSSRLGGCHYVAGALHQTIPETALIIDLVTEGSFDQHVVLQTNHSKGSDCFPLSKLGLMGESIVKVRYFRRADDCNFYPALNHLRRLGERLQSQWSSTSRNNHGSIGFM